MHGYTNGYTYRMGIKMGITQSSPVSFYKLSRQQLLTLAIALEDQRDRALSKLADVWDEALTAAEHHCRDLNPSEVANPYRNEA